MSAIYEGGSGDTRPDIPEIVSEYVTADKPETSTALSSSLETNSTNFTTILAELPPPHTGIVNYSGYQK